jgi:hypothetical protein
MSPHIERQARKSQRSPETSLALQMNPPSNPDRHPGRDDLLIGF